MTRLLASLAACGRMMFERGVGRLAYRYARRRLRAWLFHRDPHGPLYLSGPGVDDAMGDQPFIHPDHAAKISAANATRHVQTGKGNRT